MMVHPILKDITVDEWGQNGVICTDGGASGILWKEHKYYSDSAWAAAAAVKAGINQFLDRHTGPIKKASEERLLKEADIDSVIRGDFRVMIKLGLLDPPAIVPYASIKDGEEPWLGNKNKELVREVTRKYTWCNAGWEKCPVPSDGKEAVDRQTIYLEQEELNRQVYRINPKTVVVPIASFQYAITWTEHNIPAIVHLTYNSQEEGNALADVLFGDYNPGGRLVQTWPRSMEQLLPMMDYNIRNGRTYMYFKGARLYSFGYGLSYTNFAWSNFKPGNNTLKPNGEMVVTVDIKNTGKVTGDEMAQVYIQQLHSVVDRPQKELKAFKRITLKPGESKIVQLKLKAGDLRYWDEGRHQYMLEADEVKLMLGNSSADVKFQQVITIMK